MDSPSHQEAWLPKVVARLARKAYSQEKCVKLGQGQGFVASLAIELWLSRPHYKIVRHFLVFPARKLRSWESPENLVMF